MTNSLAPRLLHTALPQKSGVPVEPAPASTRRVNSRTLLGQSTSLIIDHEGVSVRALEVSESTQAYVHDKYLGWGAFLPEEKITLRWTEGSHETMLSPGLVGGVAKHLLEYLTHE